MSQPIKSIATKRIKPKGTKLWKYISNPITKSEIIEIGIKLINLRLIILRHMIAFVSLSLNIVFSLLRMADLQK
jgi:hypothetical protein